MRVAGLDVELGDPVGGGDICRAHRGRLADGTQVFVKTAGGVPDDFFTAEARGLAFLDVEGGPPVPQVRGAGPDGLVLEWIEPGAPSVAAAEQLGHSLAVLHGHREPTFGAAADGYIGRLPLPNSAAVTWPEFYVVNRLEPYLDALDADGRHIVGKVCDRIDVLAGPSETASRVHGDLWSGNVLWCADSPAHLVDAAAAHGGHRESDLAMLALFGAPHLDVILSAYDEQTPLADGWRDRVALHQLHPLLVHAEMFGGGYDAQVAAAARGVLGGRDR